MHLKKPFRFFILFLFTSFSVVSYAQEKAAFEWARGFNGTVTEAGFAITTDLAGNVITTGRFNGTTDANPGAGVFNLTSAGATDIFVSKLDINGNFVWALRIGGTADEWGNSVKTDAAGNIYVGGQFNAGSPVDFNPGTTGTFNLTSAGGYDSYIVKLDRDGNFLWAVRFGSTQSENVASLRIDTNGDVYACGDFQGTVDFDPGSGTSNLTVPGAAGTVGGFLTKLDVNGNFIYARLLGANLNANGVATDASGNVHVTGIFSGTTDFDPGAGSFNMTAPGGFNDIYVTKLNSAGIFVWARQVGGTSTEAAETIVADASGNVHIAGGFMGTTDFDPGPGTVNLTSQSAIFNDGFVLKLDPNGNFVWVYSIRGPENEYVTCLALDGNNNVYATGSFDLTADFDPGPGYKTLSANSNNMFVVKLNPSGSLVWAANLGGPNGENPLGLTTDLNNHVIATGFFSTTADFNPDAPIVNLSGLFNEVFIVKLSSETAEATTASAFDTSADGWTTVNAIGSPTPVYSSTGGNPGAMIGAQDITVGAGPQPISYFRAPASFIGNLCSSYGKSLRYDIQQTVSRAYVAAEDVIISNGSITLEYNPSTGSQIYPAIAPAWSTFSIPLMEGPGWLNSLSGTPATQAEMKQVLCAVTRLDIRGRYGTASAGIGNLDNPTIETLTKVPPPVITSFTPASAIPGSTLTITGTGFDPTPANNIVFFGAIQAVVSTASVTQLQVTVPKGARYGTITVLNNTTSLIGQSLKNFDPAFTDGGRIIPASLKLRQEINLGAGTNFSAGLALADIDNDGWVDIITTESSAGVSIFRNLGTGGSVTPASFAPKVTLSQANGKLRVGDMDGDGRQDIAVLYAITFGYVTLYRNTSSPGSVSFALDQQLESPSTSVRDIHLADLDGDGRLDLLESFSNTSTPGVFSFGAWQGISEPGNIEFCAYKSFDLSSFGLANEISIGDLNNDNKSDVIVVNNANTQFHILENTSTYGVISFGAPFVVTGAVVVRGRIQVADFNNDNKLDLAWRSNTTNSVRIRTNTNTGGALVAADFATELILQSTLTGVATTEGELAVSDINGDGKPDILATDDNDFGIFENLHTGGALAISSFSFYKYQGPGAGARPAAPETADLNGDGRPDIVFGTLSTGTQAKIVISENINVHTPTISLTTVSPLRGPVGSTVTITGDYFSGTASENNVYFGPAQATVLTATKNTLTVSVPPGATHAPVSVTVNQLTAQYHLPFNAVFSLGSTFDASSFRPPVNFTLTGADLELDVADVNGDNKTDVVAEGTLTRSYAFMNQHTGTNINTLSLVADDTVLITEPRLMDINGDSRPDLLGAASIARNNTSSVSEIEFNNSLIAANNLTGFADLNRDGRIDLVGTNGTTASIHENQSRLGLFASGGFPTISSAMPLTKASTGGYTVAADFNNDGWPDIASTNPTSDNLTVWRNNGGPRLAPSLFTSLGTTTTMDLPQRLYAGDLDTDGKMDLVVVYGSTGTSGTLVSVFHNQSTGTITFSRQDFTLSSLAGPATIADLDGDGKPEIITTHEASGSFTIMKNVSVAGTINASSFTFSTLSLTAPRAVTAGDINSDGRLDLIFTSAPNSLIVLENLIPKATISFTAQPAPTSTCEAGNASFSVTATGDNNLVYQWQADNGGFVNLANDAVYSGVNSNTLTITGATSALNGKNYRVLVRGDVTLNTASSAAGLTVNTRPAQPIVTSSVAPVGNTISICSGDVKLTAPAGFSSYLWSNAAVSQEITTSQAGSYTVQVTGANGCISIISSTLTVVINTALCNIPPVINPDTVVTQIEGKVNFDLSQFISDTDNNLDFTTLKIVSPPISGAPASIVGNNLVIDYSGKNFSGPDHIIIEICDLAGSCTQEEIIINVVGDIYVYNAVSPNNDAKNDFLFLQYIDALESTRKNHVAIFNRWGDKVYEADNYDNGKVKFEGKNSNGNDLPSGTYFFKIDFFGKPKRGQKTGYFSLKR